MGILDKIKNVFGGGGSSEEAEFEKAIASTLREYAAKHDYFWSPEIHETPTWTDHVKNWPDEKKVRFILWIVPVMHRCMAGKTSWSSDDKDFKLNNVREAYIRILFRQKLVLADAEAIQLGDVFLNYLPGDHRSITHWPIGLFLNQLHKQKSGQNFSPALKNMLENIKIRIAAINQSFEEKERLKMIEKIDAMLFGSVNETNGVKPARFLGEDPFAAYANPAIEKMPQTDKLNWYKILPLAQKATGAKPSKKFLDDIKVIIKELGNEKFKKTVLEWLQFLVDLKEREEQHSYTYHGGYTHNYTSYDYITAVNAEAVKGLVWACAHFHDNATVKTIAALAERAFKKIPGKGPTAASLGNACLYALYKSKGLDGIGQLSRLKLRIKQASTQALIDKYLQAAAEEQGVSVNEIEDMAIDDYGFENGLRTFLVDEYRAEIVLGVGKTAISWYKPDGSLQKSVPAIVKQKHAARLNKIKDISKQAEQTLIAQRDRLDRMFRSGREISWPNFEKYYLQHGLMNCLSKKIIWRFHKGAQSFEAIYLNNHWVNAENEVVKINAPDAISLWHPVQASVAAIKAWRDFLVFHQVLQPLKQAFREVYLLTDAEVNTKSYSNRMAAHILRQHQFNSLAKTRGWRYALMGAFDNGMDNGTASLQLPEHKLAAEYWINEVNADGAMNDTGIWNYVSTDQVRFKSTTTNNIVDLVDVPPLVLSEVLRDVDLFVGVASVGNDPAWQDSGGAPAYRDYWTSYSFGELSEIAKSRKEILTNLLPRLKIKEVATIKDKFLIVKGKLRTYKIHIGSTNILMEPNDQYLCIVPDRSQKNYTENLFLPFEGDNGLSIILSKAFLLSDDDKITDSTIVSQIQRK